MSAVSRLTLADGVDLRTAAELSEESLMRAPEYLPQRVHRIGEFHGQAECLTQIEPEVHGRIVLRSQRIVKVGRNVDVLT